jgi:hypothetical protein
MLQIEEDRMRTTGAATERRRSPRVNARGHVIFHGVSCARGAIIDMSAHGVRVRMSGRRARYLRSDRVTLELRLEGGCGGWSTLSGHVVRLDVGGEVMLALDEPPPDYDDAVQDQLLAVLEADAVQQVLLVDPIGWRRTKLAASMRVAGGHVREAATPLEALAHLGESRERFHVIAVADTVPATVAEELREYLHAEHAGIRVVRVAARSVSR